MEFMKVVKWRKWCKQPRGYRLLLYKCCSKAWIYSRNTQDLYYSCSTNPPAEFDSREEAIACLRRWIKRTIYDDPEEEYSRQREIDCHYKPILESPDGVRVHLKAEELI